MEVKLKLSPTETIQLQALKNLDKFYDCGLITEGKSINGHRIVLASVSPYIEDILKNIKTPGSSKYPILIFENIKIESLQLMVDLVYLHEVSVKPNQAEEFLATLKFFKVKFLNIEYPKLPSRPIETLSETLPMKISLTPVRRQSQKKVEKNTKILFQEQNFLKKLQKRSKSMFTESQPFPRFMHVNFAEQLKAGNEDLREISALVNKSSRCNFN